MEVSLRAVNGRFFDVKFHLPSEYVSYEKDIRDRLAKRVHRGSLSIVVLRKQRKGPSSKQVVIDADLAKQWVEGFRNLADSLKLKDQLSIDALTRVPDIASIRDNPKVHGTEKGLVLQCFGAALAKFEKERLREGQQLKKDMAKRLRSLESIRLEIFKYRSEAQVQIKKKLDKKQSELTTFDSQRWADEVVWYLEKNDIDEELTRLKEHIRHFQSLMSVSGGQGKKLDFYTQELLREVNTIGSKSNNSKITQAVIEAKTLIEQIKEQVQNIE